ncbi:MAG: ribonuclease HI family protein [Patescibacteria group bacterium]
MSVTIFTDGGARGNPGPAGAGAVLYKGKKILAEVSEYLGHQTNNYAEYQALLLALEACREKLGSPVREPVMIKMDSELIVRQMKGEYRVKEPTLKLLHADAQSLIHESFPKIEFIHVRRELNAEADALANQAMDRGE